MFRHQQHPGPQPEQETQQASEHQSSNGDAPLWAEPQPYTDPGRAASPVLLSPTVDQTLHGTQLAAEYMSSPVDLSRAPIPNADAAPIELMQTTTRNTANPVQQEQATENQLAEIYDLKTVVTLYNRLNIEKHDVSSINLILFAAIAIFHKLEPDSLQVQMPTLPSLDIDDLEEVATNCKQLLMTLYQILCLPVFSQKLKYQLFTAVDIIMNTTDLIMDLISKKQKDTTGIAPGELAVIESAPYPTQQEQATATVPPTAPLLATPSSPIPDTPSVKSPDSSSALDQENQMAAIGELKEIIKQYNKSSIAKYEVSNINLVLAAAIAIIQKLEPISQQIQMPSLQPLNPENLEEILQFNYELLMSVLVNILSLPAFSQKLGEPPSNAVDIIRNTTGIIVDLLLRKRNGMAAPKTEGDKPTAKRARVIGPPDATAAASTDRHIERLMRPIAEVGPTSATITTQTAQHDLSTTTGSPTARTNDATTALFWQQFIPGLLEPVTTVERTSATIVPQPNK
jgi:hypothetical protein